ncbi:MAG TPA: alpha/beta hydrolase [Dictyobacter sp.]|jgi:pimeloyl-ACP methyl ester carboxylesterase|nr:alpha/beta hydrolase [Dictyobacter sp.]
MIKPIRDEQIVIGSIALHCVQWGTHGSPVIFLHGLTANAFCFQTFADELATEYQVIAYDLRGRGDSAKPASGYSVPIHAADLAQFIATQHLQCPVIIGHSLGALIALYFAAHYPDKLSGLVLIDAGAPLWQNPAEQPAWLTAAITRLGTPTPSFEDYKARLQKAPFPGPHWNDAINTYFEHDITHQNDGSVISKAALHAILEEGQNFYQAHPDQQWEHVQVPTLLLRAGQKLFVENDQLLSEQAAQSIQQHIANCRYINYPTLNHYTIIFGIEQGPAQEIRKFLYETTTKIEKTR